MSTDGNAIALAKTPNYDRYLRTCANSSLDASAQDVGLPAGQMGNSEVGHMSIGSGRVILQDLPRIDQAIEDGELEGSKVLKRLANALQGTRGACHLLGLISPGGVHSHQNHILSVAKVLASQSIDVKVHAMLDGRDTSPKSAVAYVREFETDTSRYDNISIATVCGRYYAMDRDKRWDRVQLAYDAIMLGSGPKHRTANSVLQAGYDQGTSDEFILPSVIGGFSGVNPGDGLMMANFRADRVRS